MGNRDVLNNLRAAMESDEVFTAFNKVLGRIRSEFNYNRDNQELSYIHANRAGRDLYLEPSIPKADKLSNAMLKNIADRSRIVEIGLPLRRYRKTVKRKVAMITKYLMVEREDLFAEVRHKTVREDIIECLLREAYDLEGELDAVIEGIDEITKDIDQSGFGTRDTVQLTATVHRNLGVGSPGS